MPGMSGQNARSPAVEATRSGAQSHLLFSGIGLSWSLGGGQPAATHIFSVVVVVVNDSKQDCHHVATCGPCLKPRYVNDEPARDTSFFLGISHVNRICICIYLCSHRYIHTHTCT